MSHVERYHQIQELLRHGSTLAYNLDDQSLGHGLIDLSRQARKEIEMIGMKGGHSSVPLDSYEGMLLYRLIPEISRRLIRKGGARLLLLEGERPGADVTNIPGDSLRRLTGDCVAKSAFDIVAEKVRDRFDPDFLNTSTFFACEAIQRDCRSGNIVEIGLSRAVPANHIQPTQDFFAGNIEDWLIKQGISMETPSWSPEVPDYDPEMPQYSSVAALDAAEEAMGPERF
ncbi:hypothetical protein LCGC14_0112430 [marine sediment metagenome]|jgi:hypothetical protein|uniref:Uncharacterized protein n=2 Tax=root TaxID=1 RepID=A0A7V1BE35_9RHOB|nr:hypothetical protein [Sulfitobacter litoralis]HDZ51488.1 hypothetical protein [Sulfitobacter litoralis]